jgi:hypothetical protein
MKGSGSAFDFFGGNGDSSSGGITLEDTLTKGGDTGAGGMLDFGGLTLAQGSEDHSTTITTHATTPGGTITTDTLVLPRRPLGPSTPTTNGVPSVIPTPAPTTPPAHVVTGISARPVTVAPVVVVAPQPPVPITPTVTVDLKDEQTLTATLAKLHSQVEAVLVLHFSDAKRFNDAQVCCMFHFQIIPFTLILICLTG